MHWPTAHTGVPRFRILFSNDRNKTSKRKAGAYPPINLKVDKREIMYNQTAGIPYRGTSARIDSGEIWTPIPPQNDYTATTAWVLRFI